MRRVRWATLGFGLMAANAVAQEVPSDTLLTLNHYMNLETVSEPKVSPDGMRAVYTRRFVNKMEDTWETALWMVNTDGGKNRFLTKGSGAVWSPDGTRLAYVAQGEPKGSQIFVRWMDAEGATSQITRLTESPENLKWSPDGRWLAFTMLVPKSEELKIDLPAAPAGAKWTKAPRYVTRLHYRADRRGFLESGYVHLFVIPVDGGTPRDITPGDWSVGARAIGLPGGVGYDWTPDGKTIVVDGLAEPDADLRFRESYIYAVKVATGDFMRLPAPKGFWTNPVVSPDGQHLAFTGFEWTKQTYKVPDLYVARLDGSTMRSITLGFDRTPTELQWAADGSGVYFTTEDKGSMNLHFAAFTGGARPLTLGTHMLNGTSIARNGTVVGVRTAFQEPTDVVVFHLPRRPGEAVGPLAKLTHLNEDLLAGKRLAQAEEIWYRSTGDTRVQGWIVKPPGFDTRKKYPMILEIHGGPHGMYNVAFNYMWQNFAADGYVVLYINPRGSTGYGTAFGNAIDKAYPSVDYEDLMAGVDTVVARGYIDTRSMFVSGCSGGGVLSSWTIGHTDRFAAAAVRCPVINWISFQGDSDIPLFEIQWFDKPFWEDPAPWLRQSPLMYVGNVKTPTLLMTGVLDMRTPMPETEQYYTSLKLRGVPTGLLRFEDEWHGTGSKPSNFMRTQLYMMAWFKKWGGGTKTAAGTN